MSAQMARRAQMARQRAYRRLAERHREEYEELFVEERRKIGLPPPKPIKRGGDDTGALEATA